jgi:hypothetical protein
MEKGQRLVVQDDVARGALIDHRIVE